MTKSESKKLISQAKEFVKKYNITSFIHTKEGSIIYLEELLVDFIKYLNSDEEESLLSMLRKFDDMVKVNDDINKEI